LVFSSKTGKPYFGVFVQKLNMLGSAAYKPGSSISKVIRILPFALFLICLGIPIVVKSPYLLHVLIFVFLYSALGSSWNIIGGYAGQWSLGHAAFFGIGAYTSTLLLIHFDLTPWVGAFIGGLVASSISLLIGYPCFNLKTHYFAMATVTFGEIMRLIFLWLPFTGGATGLTMPIGEIPSLYYGLWADKRPYYYLTLFLAVGAVIITYQIDRSRLGMYFKAIKQDEEGASNLGIDATKFKLMAMGMSTFLTAMAGTMYAQYVQYIEPASVMPFMLSIMMILIPIFGGVGTVFGPVVGALVLTPIAEITRVFLGGRGVGIDMIIYGIVIILLALYFPGGVISTLKRRKKL
jgi:branched-chain amino acid transport system permease protein